MLERIAAGAGGVATLARAVRPVLAAINTEAKYYDKNASVVAYNPGTNDQLIDITSEINQGLTDVQRIGDSALFRNLRVKVKIDATFVAASMQTIYSRVCLIGWKENIQSNAPTIAKLFRTPTSIIGAFNKDYTDQMVVLHDQINVHDPCVTLTSRQSGVYIDWFDKLEHHARWLGPLTTDGTVQHYFLVIRGDGATSANQVNAEYWSRLNFTDN